MQLLKRTLFTDYIHFSGGEFPMPRDHVKQLQAPFLRLPTETRLQILRTTYIRQTHSVISTKSGSESVDSKFEPQILRVCRQLFLAG